MKPELLKNLFGTDDADAIVASKSKKEARERVFSGGKVVKVPMSEAECRKLCEKIGVEFLSGYEGRVLQYTLSDETVDRYGDVVVAGGVDLKNYMKNSVIMTFHDYGQFPIGNALKVWADKADKKVKGWVLFVDDRVDRTGLAETAFRFASSGIMKAGSIGFLPYEWKKPSEKEKEAYGMDDWGVIYPKWELLEFSVCPVPANPNAVQDSVRKGITADFIRGQKDVLGDSFDTVMKKIEALDSEMRAVVPFKSYPLADEADSWDAGEEVKAAEDVATLKKMSTWYDADDAENKGAYKLPHHKAADLNTVWNGVAAAMGALLGARGGADIPDDEKAAVHAHLSKHYEEFEKEPPELKSYTKEELIELGFEAQETHVLNIKIEGQEEIKAAAEEMSSLVANLKEANTEIESTMNMIRSAVGELQAEVSDMSAHLKSIGAAHGANEPYGELLGAIDNVRKAIRG